jgi:alpha-D-xyloside xylohydrolase
MYPDPKCQIARLKTLGLCKKVCIRINPHTAQHGAAFKYPGERVYLLKRKNGDVWQCDLWQAGMALVGFFTNPKAIEWYVERGG